MINNIEVSLVIPIYNEEEFIEDCYNSLRENTFPNENIEYIFIDGNSNDQTLKILRKMSSLNSNIIILENPKKITPIAMNLGIKTARGKYIIRIDAHAKYAPDYIEKCIELLKKTGADNVGGCIETKPSKNTLIAQSISYALSHKFGVGNSDFRTVKEEKESDTVPFGAFPKDIFEKYGYYNELLVRNQDIELNSRIKKNGGKIILSPSIRCTYFSRGNYKGLWEQNYNNGKWNIFTSFITANALSLRHFIPLIFVLSLIVSSLLTIFIPVYGSLLFALVLGTYILVSLLISVKIASTRGWKYLFIQPFTFLILHFSYGIGSLLGILQLHSFNTKIREKGEL